MILDVLYVLKLRKTCGPDHISNHMLKYTASDMSKPLHKRFFTSLLRLAVFPNS